MCAGPWRRAQQACMMYLTVLGNAQRGGTMTVQFASQIAPETPCATAALWYEDNARVS